MSKQVYISADYDQNNGDQAVVEELTKWGSDNLHKVDFIDMSKVSSGSITKSSDSGIQPSNQRFLCRDFCCWRYDRLPYSWKWMRTCV